MRRSVAALDKPFSEAMLIARPVQHSGQIVRLNLCFAPAASMLRQVTARAPSSMIYWRMGECENRYRELHDQNEGTGVRMLQSCPEYLG